MRRLWLLLLAFVLPLQMSWAAVHLCDDTRPLAHAVQAVEFGDDHADQADSSSSGAQAEHSADACCGSAHGCHGLHHLMGQASCDFAAPAVKQLLALSGASPPLSELLTRVERPKWLAA